MAAAEVPQTLKYRGGQLNVAPVLEVENFTNWKKIKNHKKRSKPDKHGHGKRKSTQELEVCYQREYRMMRQEDGLVELSYGREMMEMMIADSSGDDVDDEDEDDEDGEGEEEEHLTLSTLLFDITC
ncbi:hypothetical protein Tco_0382581 [Tanacetum coccineum]